MSQLFEKIQQDLLAERKIKSPYCSTLRTVVGEIQTKSKMKNAELDDTIVISVVKSNIKGLDQTIEQLAETNRNIDHLAACAEKKFLEKYLPKIMSEDELRDVITPYMTNGTVGIGEIMQMLKSSHPNQYDAKMASNIIKDMMNAS